MTIDIDDLITSLNTRIAKDNLNKSKEKEKKLKIDDKDITIRLSYNASTDLWTLGVSDDDSGFIEWSDYADYDTLKAEYDKK